MPRPSKVVLVRQNCWWEWRSAPESLLHQVTSTPLGHNLSSLERTMALWKADRRENWQALFSKTPPGTPSWRARLVTRQKVEGTVVGKADPPRSYTVETPKGQLRRNRCYLNRLPETPNTNTSTALSSPSPDVRTSTSPELTASATPVAPRRTTRSGHEIRLPRSFKVTVNLSVHLVLCRLRNFNQLLRIFLRLWFEHWSFRIGPEKPQWESNYVQLQITIQFVFDSGGDVVWSIV